MTSGYSQKLVGIVDLVSFVCPARLELNCNSYSTAVLYKGALGGTPTFTLVTRWQQFSFKLWRGQWKWVPMSRGPIFRKTVTIIPVYNEPFTQTRARMESDLTKGWQELNGRVRLLEEGWRPCCGI